MSGILPDSIPGWAGWAVAAAAPILVWIRDRRKSDIDESALVLGKWKELVEQHQADIKGIREEFSAYKRDTLQETSDLRERLRKAEAEIIVLREQNAGLKRAIAQNSQSGAYQLTRATGGVPDEDMTARLDRAGHNLKGSQA